MSVPKPLTLHLTLHRKLEIIDWNEQGPFLDNSIPQGTDITVTLSDYTFAPEYTAYGPLEDVLYAAAQVPCPDFGSDEADLEMQANPPYFTCDRFPDTIDNALSFARCRGDQTRCPAHPVRREAQKTLTPSQGAPS